MTQLFQPITINGKTLSNRIVRSATWEGMADPDGRPTPKLIDFYKHLAAGKVGLIISGFAYVRPDGKQLPGKMGIYDDSFGAEYQAMADAVHEAGGKIAMQLVHAGGQVQPQEGTPAAVAPSAVEVAQFPQKPTALTVDGIANIIDCFAAAARRAKAWGFDAVQLHGAHGYLINQFLSPLTNRRDDQYGGSDANRARFGLEVYEAARDAVGPDFPVMIKLNAADNVEGGLTLEGALVVAQMLSEAGIDAIEVSSGTPASGADNPARMKINAPEKEAYNLELAIAVQKKTKCTIMAVGGFRSFEVAEKAINDGMDLISMSRPLIREPDLPRRWQAGDLSPAACISCNGCFKPGMAGGIYCVAAKKKNRK